MGVCALVKKYHLATYCLSKLSTSGKNHHLIFKKLLESRVCTILIQKSEKARASHSSTLAWKIPWTEEPGRLQSFGALGVGHN